MLLNLNQVTLPVKNMKEASEFYIQLGFLQIVDTPHYARFECKTGSASFSLSLEQGDFCNGAIIYFEHEKLDEWYEDLVNKGIVFEQQPENQRYLWREAVLRDPSSAMAS
jgi:catechol 2,3-dioxygenase-like lactoylglutathione lyase family enzyme